MNFEQDQRIRARIGCVSEGAAAPEALTSLCAKAGYSLHTSISAEKLDLCIFDLRGVTISLAKANARVDAMRRTSPEAPALFLIDPDSISREGAALRRFGEIVPTHDEFDHVMARIRETLRLRNIAEEAGERLKTLSALNRAVEFPVIAADTSPPRVLIVGAPGPAAISAFNALATVSDICVCVLTAGQAMRALDHQHFDVALFMPSHKDTATPALLRALRRHPKFSHMALLQLVPDANDLAAAARKGGADFIVQSQIPTRLGLRVEQLARRSRLVQSMRGFLKACAGEGVRDRVSSAFTPGFLTQHGARIAARADETSRPLSVIVLRLTDPSAGKSRAGDRALRHAARLISKITRAEDTTARIAPGVFAFLCPATTLADASHIALRLEGILSNTAFRRDKDGTPCALKVESGAAEHAINTAIGETLSEALRAMERADVLKSPLQQSPQ